ncbi:uncharacterized protein L969DRAFT_86258 [Mixia osmundae IAM 14324]|uniref:Cwf18 pre-mRNA splicing factor n=1 Tax=Mixia osmundae (strain CBS 9802 / IAM 14324 / JCM 22182 / KY 12970) TaxID=764103 RepID=G7DU88_MIXOS|nr:uncharacterized protein L969DRAFT_86258 [Mixia osmundae IAM 14324]KEI41017.1 hypothetical protein L969DRAFT_86258 [Mixia osmundae IAM 14324]GAA94148.1 hypothetical protein E5Q_00796 [Mixia osmundae IAM 14324]
MSLDAAAASRKEKLAALKKRKETHDAAHEHTNGQARAEPFKFRNYDPVTRQPKGHDRSAEEETVESLMRGKTAEIIREDEARRQEELDLTNLQPKKPNWDLRRDLDRKLASLEPKTNAAIAQLIRNRIAESKSQQGGQDLASAVEQRTEESDEDEDV